MCIRMANSEAVAHTPQPHIGEAYVGITRSISTMYRGAVPITEHQSADVLEKLCQKSKKQKFSYFVARPVCRGKPRLYL